MKYKNLGSYTTNFQLWRTRLLNESAFSPFALLVQMIAQEARAEVRAAASA